MTTTASRVIPVTDDRGKLLLPEEDCHEPEPASVVLTEGLTGTAWQRQFASGLWTRIGGGQSITWADMIRKRNVVLVYDAPKRAEQ